MLRKLLFGAVIVFSNSASAVGTDYNKISWLSVENGNVYLKTEPALNLSACGVDHDHSKNFVTIQKGSDGFELMYSMALAAYSSKQNIRFFGASCVTSPWGTSMLKVYSTQLGEN